MNNVDHIHGDIGESVLESDDLFFPEFGLEMEHIGYLNPSLSSYLVSLKYDFHELWSYTWLPIHSSHTSKMNIPFIVNIERDTQIHLENILHGALWVIRNNAIGTSVLANKLAKSCMTPLC